MEYTNAIPHQINVYNEEGVQLFTLSPSIYIRASTHETVISCVDGVLITKKVLGAPVIEAQNGTKLTVEDLPQKGLVVRTNAASSLRAAGFGGQLLTPNTDPRRVVHDTEGRIIGSTGFVQHP